MTTSEAERRAWTRRIYSKFSVTIAAIIFSLLCNRAGAQQHELKGGTDAGASAPASSPAFLEHHIPEINFDRVALGDALDFLADISSLAFDVDWNALKTEGVSQSSAVTMKIKDKPFSTVVTLLLDTAAGAKGAILKCRG